MSTIAQAYRPANVVKSFEDISIVSNNNNKNFIVHPKTRYIGVTRIYLREVAFYRVSSLTYTLHLYLKESVFFDGSIDLYFSKQFEGSSYVFSGSIGL